MINIEQLCDNLILVKNISNKNDAVVFHEGRIITVSDFNQEMQGMQYFGIYNSDKKPTVEECKNELNQRVITLGLPTTYLEQEITAAFLEEEITEKIIKECHKGVAGLSREEVESVVKQELEENLNQNETNLFDILVISKLEAVKQAKQKQNKTSSNSLHDEIKIELKKKSNDNRSENRFPRNIEAKIGVFQQQNKTTSNQLLNEIRIELEQIKIANISEDLFPLNIETEIDILQKINEELLKEILESLRQINSTANKDDILKIEYNSLNENAKQNVSLEKFKQNSNMLVDACFTLNQAYELIKDMAIESNNNEDFDKQITLVSTLVNNINTIITESYNQLDKKQFITLFQFRQAVKHFCSLGFNWNIAIEKTLQIVNTSNDFTSFYGRVSMAATTDEEKRGYGSKIQVENVYNEAKRALDAAGILPLLESESALAEKQKNTNRDEFKDWVASLLSGSNQPLPLPPSIINSLDYSASISNSLDDAIGFSSINNSTSPTKLANLNNVQPVNKNISLSKMLNFGSTCWLNSSLKFIYTFYGDTAIKTAINTKLKDINQLADAKLQEQLKELLRAFSEIIDSLSKHENVDFKILKLLVNIHECAQNLPGDHKDKIHIEEIDKLINAAFNGNRLEEQHIPQQSADEFISPIVAFLNLGSESNELTKKIFRDISIAKKDLDDIGLKITTDSLALDEIESAATESGRIIQLPETPADNNSPIKIEYFKDYCTRAKNKFNYKDIKSSTKDSDQIPATTKITERVLADINSLDKFTLKTDYGTNQNNDLVRDTSRIMQKLKLMFPSLKIEITDEKTKQSYMIEARPETMVLFMGAKEVGGHYCTASIDNNGNIFIHNDTRNNTIEDEYYERTASPEQLTEFTKKTTTNKLLEYIVLQQLYPTSIGFKVTSKTLIQR
jgi:Asp-tRNA(Asn)/Glu-tRNA(Gln) amidotransferase C subunit